MLTKGRKSWENYHHVLKSFIGWGEGKDSFCSVRSRRQHIRRHRVKRKKMAHTNLGGKKIAAQNTRSPQKRKLALSFVNIIYNLNAALSASKNVYGFNVRFAELKKGCNSELLTKITFN